MYSVQFLLVHTREFIFTLNFPLYKQEYLRNPLTNKVLKGIVVNRTRPSINGRPIDITLTVPLA